MKFTLISFLFLSLASHAIEFEVIGDFRNNDELKNWVIESKAQKPKASLTYQEKNTLFSSEEENQQVELTRKGDWDFSQFTHFMADVSTDGQSYTVSLTDKKGMLENYNCHANFSVESSPKISTIKIPIEEFECDKEKAKLDLSTIQEMNYKFPLNRAYLLGISPLFKPLILFSNPPRYLEQISPFSIKKIFL